MPEDREKEKKEMNRRSFLKSGAAGAGAAVSLSGCGGGEEKLIPLLIPDEPIVPGLDKWTASTCGVCAAACGILVRSMPGEARVVHSGQERRQMTLQVKKIEGNPAHPVNRGKLCARGQAGPQVLYNPDRLRTPMKLSGARGSGQYEPITWEAALDLILQKLEPFRSGSNGRALAAIAGPSSGMRRKLLREFLAALGSERSFVEEPPGFSVLREANRRMFGRAELEIHDLENARYLLSFGADFLESHTSPVRYNLGLGDFRQGRPGVRGKFVQVESRFSLTAANADEWLPARAGTEGEVALAMAAVILREELYDAQAVKTSVRGFEQFRRWVVEKYSPERIAEAVDIPSQKIIRIALEFARHQPAIAFSGGAAVAQSHGVFAAAAVQSLNALAGSLGRRGGISWNASSARPEPLGTEPLRYWAEEFLAAAGEIELLILWDVDPAYNTAAAYRVREAIQRIPFSIAFTPFMNDSASLADLVLPERTFLERWDLTESEPATGNRSMSITQPIVRPMYESRDGADVLLGIISRWGGTIAGKISDDNFEAYLRRNLSGREVLQKGSFSESDADSFWETLKATGVWVDSAPSRAAAVADLAFLPSEAPPPPSERDSDTYPLALIPFVSLGLGEGRSANLPWIQELPDPMTSVVWNSWVEINPNTAREFGIEENDLVWIESEAGKIRLPAVIFPGARPDAVNVPFGQGHRLFGRYASGRGANPWEVLSARTVRNGGEAAWGATRVRIRKSGERVRLVKIGHDREHTPAELSR